MRPATNFDFNAHKWLRLPQNLHFEVHNVLRLPRNPYFKVHKVLHLPRNLPFKVHKVLRLLRSPHFKVHTVLCLPRNMHLKPQGPQVLRLPRNPHIKIHIAQPCRSTSQQEGFQRQHQNFKTHLSLHNSSGVVKKRAQRSRFTAPATKSEPAEDHHHVNPRIKVKLLLHPPRRVGSSRLPRKVTTKSKNVQGTTTTAQSKNTPVPAHQVLRACAVEMHFEDFEVNECTVNGSELAAHGCENHRSDTRP